MKDEKIEYNVRERRGNTYFENIDVQLMPWKPDIGFSCSKDTKYFNQIDIHWYTKTIIE